MRRTAALLLLVTSACGGCAPPASKGDLNSDNPASKLYAISRAGQRRDHTAVPALVEQLDSDDPAVRMMAIGALERITGERMGYNPYDSPDRRRPAIEAWTAAVHEGRFAQRSLPTKGTP